MSIPDELDPFAVVSRLTIGQRLRSRATPLDISDANDVEASELRDLPLETGIPITQRNLFRYSGMRHPFLGLEPQPPSLQTMAPTVGHVSLSRWQPTDIGAPSSSPLSQSAGPRLAVAAMLRAAPPAAVDGFLRYYHGIGFEQIILFFDKPDEDPEALAIAKAHAAECGGVTIHLCDEAWWESERQTSRTYLRARAVEQMKGSRIEDRSSWPQGADFRWVGDREVAQLVDHTQDVQSRQQVVMGHALTDLWCQGFDWMLQLDIDELLYLPKRSMREDARVYFASLPSDIDNVTFHNHEVMPCESFKVDDWFAQCTLFKVSPHMVADHDYSNREVERGKRVERHAQGEDFDPHAIPDVSNNTIPSTLSEVLDPIANAREAAVAELHKRGLRLPSLGKALKNSAETHERMKWRQLAADDNKRQTYWERQKKAKEMAAERAERREARMAADGEKETARRASLEKLAEEVKAEAAERQQLQGGGRGGSGFVPGDYKDSRPDYRGAASLYFHAHAQGKQAVRIRPIFYPPSGGVHGVSGEGRTLKSHTAVGPTDPCVLHYANCGFDYWVRKYEVLGDIPNGENRKTLDGFRKHWKGGEAAEEEEGEDSGSFSVHLAARDLVVRGVGSSEGGEAGEAGAAVVGADEARKQSNRDALERFYRTFIMGNTFGEAHHLAAVGLLVRVRGPSKLLKELRAKPKRVRKACGPPPPLLPPPKHFDPSLWLKSAWHWNAPYRRRVKQWRVVFKSKIVARTRPSTSAVPVQVFEPGTLIWSGEPREAGWVCLSDAPQKEYVLIDATRLGLSRLLEEVEPPILSEGACETCKCAPCYCEVLAALGL